MKVLYCDCFSGASGDMLLGALIDVGVDVELLRNELSKLGLNDEYQMTVEKAIKRGISATDVQVNLIAHTHSHDHEHNHTHDSDHNNHSHGHHHHSHSNNHHSHHHHRNLSDIAKVIDNSGLDPDIKSRAKYVFQRLAKAEAKVHGTTIDMVHFHEVGAVDAIVDIVGTVIAISLLGIDKIVVSPLPTGSGFIECAHGIIPVPAPATSELLKGVPIYDPGIKGELVTPTGAALITSLADEFGQLPTMEVSSIGYGAGNRDYGIPNVLRVFVGEIPTADTSSFKEDTIFLLNTTIDDCSPEVLGYLWDKILPLGAIDMYYTPVFMKKGRPGTLLTILTNDAALNTVAEAIFNETTTIGIRISKSSRLILEREIITLDTVLGKIRYKISGNTVKPEFEDLRRYAQSHGLSLKETYNKAISEYDRIKK